MWTWAYEWEWTRVEERPRTSAQYQYENETAAKDNRAYTPTDHTKNTDRTTAHRIAHTVRTLYEMEKGNITKK